MIFFLGPFLPAAKTGLLRVSLRFSLRTRSFHSLTCGGRLRRPPYPLSMRARREGENFTEMQVNSHKIYLPASEVFQRLYVRFIRIKFLLLPVFLYPNSKRLYEIRRRDNALSKIFITALSDKAVINKKSRINYPAIKLLKISAVTPANSASFYWFSVAVFCICLNFYFYPV